MVAATSACRPPGHLFCSSLLPTLQPPELVEILPRCPLNWSLSTVLFWITAHPLPILFSFMVNTAGSQSAFLSNLLRLPPLLQTLSRCLAVWIKSKPWASSPVLIRAPRLLHHEQWASHHSSDTLTHSWCTCRPGPLLVPGPDS